MNNREEEILQKAIEIKDGIDRAIDELGKDGVIQRFEFTFELLRKALRISLRNSGIDVKTPKESLKEAFRLGWIDNEETSEVIFERIRSSYAPAIKKIIDFMKAQSI